MQSRYPLEFRENELFVARRVEKHVLSPTHEAGGDRRGQPRACLDQPPQVRPSLRFVFESATVRGRSGYTLLDAPVLTLDVTV